MTCISWASKDNYLFLALADLEGSNKRQSLKYNRHYNEKL